MISKRLDLFVVIAHSDPDHFNLFPGGRIRLNQSKQLVVEGRLFLTGRAVDVQYFH